MGINKKKWGGLIGISFIVIISFIGLSSANSISKDEKIEGFKSGQVDIEVYETGNDGNAYEAPTNWNGDKNTKNVSITNNSSVNTLIRVAIAPRWVDENNNSWAGDTSCVEIEFSNLGTANEKNKWVKDSANQGNYYYYNGIVREGESTNDLTKSVIANIPQGIQERYKGKKLIIEVKAETIIATKEAYERAWSGIR